MVPPRYWIEKTRGRCGFDSPAFDADILTAIRDRGKGGGKGMKAEG